MKTKIKYNLKPCPFCGDSAMLFEQLQNGYTEYFVKCMDCGARSDLSFANPTRAIIKWNRRFDNENNTQSSNC